LLIGTITAKKDKNYKKLTLTIYNYKNLCPTKNEQPKNLNLAHSQDFLKGFF
jgi:hypothetical protein